MHYNFATLSPTDFEDLARDLIGAELNLRFEAFAEGPDGGMDGRHASASGSIILQAKHYHRSPFASLKSTMKKERPTINRLQTQRYILVTSTTLTQQNKEALSELIGPSLKTTGDIFGADDLNALLRKYPGVEESHPKLWAGTTAVLERVVTGAVEKAFANRSPMPEVLSRVMPTTSDVQTEIELLSVEHMALLGRVSDTSALLDQTVLNVGELKKVAGQGLVADEPLDGELNICRELVERGQYHTAFEVLKSTFGGGKRKIAISDKALARIRSLEGFCLRKLGDEATAATRFLEAARLDPSIKHLSNAVVAHLIEGDLDEARRMLDGVLAAEPNDANHWANLIYVESARGQIVPEEEIPTHLRDNQEVRLARSNALRMAGDPEWRNLAQANLRRFPDSNDARRAGSEAVLDGFIGGGRRGAPKAVSMKSLRQDAELAAAALSELWFAHEASETFRHHPDITLLQNTALGLKIAEKPNDAASLLARHLTLLRTDPQAMLMAGMIGLDAGVNELLDRVLAYGFEGDGKLRIEKAMRDGNFQAALVLVEQQEDEPYHEGHLQPDRLADMLRAATTEYSKRADSFRAVIKRYPPDGFADLILCDLCVRTEIPEIANEALDRALTVDLSGEIELRYRLSAAGMRQRRPEVAIDLLDGHVDPTIASPERTRLARAHAMVVPPRASGISFFAALRQYAADDADLQMAGGVYHLNRGAAKESVPWFRRALHANPGDAQAIVRLWIALKRDGEGARVRKLLDSVDLGAVRGEILDRLQVARLLWQTGRIEALDYAYEITARALDDPDVCLAYSHLVLSDAFRSQAPEMLTPEKVQTGAWVRLSRRVGPDFDFVLVDRDDEVAFHLTASHAIAAAALGLELGDTFETVEGPNRFEWKVEELKPRALYLFHRISSSFQDRFPGHGGLWTATIVEDDIAPILETLRQRRTQVERLQTTYFEHPLPLGSVASAGGGTTIDFALYLARTGRGVISATGRADDLENERGQAARAIGKPIVLDAYTLWLLAKLSLFDTMQRMFPRILVPQSSLDELSVLIEERNNMPDGRKTAAAMDDGFILQETSAEDVVREVVELTALRDYVQSHSEVLGIEAPESFSGETLRLADLLGNQFDCLSVAAREDAILISADLRLRQVAAAICNLPAFGLDALIEEMTAQGGLEESRKVEAVLTLCELRHSFVGLNAATLLSILRFDSTDTLDRFGCAAHYLGTPDANPESHIAVAAGFAKVAINELGGEVRTQAAVGIVLRNLVRMSNIPLAQIINAFTALADTPIITRYVRDWLKGHFLFGVYVTQVNEGRK